MNDFPALYDVARRTCHPLGGKYPFTVGRSTAADLPVTDLGCAASQFCVRRLGERFAVEPLAPASPTYYNERAIEGQTWLTHGAVLRAGGRQFLFLERALPEVGGPADGAAPSATPPPLPPPVPPRPPARARTVLVQDAAPQVASAPQPAPTAIPLFGIMLVGREVGRVQVHLDHPHVSRVHATIEVDGGNTTVSDLRSANGTFVNGRRIDSPVALRPGDRIDIGPYSLAFTGWTLVPQTRAENVEVSASGLRRTVTDRATGKPRRLLDDVSLTVHPREFVCLIGPSGSGKSTLLAALSGRARADGGTVLLNRKDLYANFEALKRDMVVVPQKDVLHDTLTVEQAALYTARLRLPPDTSAAEVRESIDRILLTVGLGPHRHTPIRQLSGGQLKRASLAIELLSRPTLIFLDEVTSGLDEQTDREMMALFRSLADAGKTVVCVTHTLANVERHCHLVAVLGEGGRLVFVGAPGEALRYFGVERLGDVYERISSRPAEEWRRRFEASPLHAQYVRGRAVPPAEVDVTPVFTPPRRLGDRVLEAGRQARLLTARYCRVLLGDGRALLMTAGQSLLVAALLVIVFGDFTGLRNVFEHGRRSVMLLFLMQISCLWFGCNNAAREIAKERDVYRRERAVNLEIFSYYASKLVVLVTISVLQTSTLFGIVQLTCRPPGQPLAVWLVLCLVAVAGVTLGLALSAAARTTDMAVALIPIVLIPQIILGGVIATLRGTAQVLAKCFVTSYWSNRALVAWLPAEVTRAASAESSAAPMPTLVLVGHAALFAVVAVAILFIRDRNESGHSGAG